VIRQTPDGVEISVRVIPRARKTELAGERQGEVLIRLSAPPVDGAANEALAAFLSTALHCPRRAVSLVSGQTGRSKRLRIDGISEAVARAALLPGRVVG
jgi:uncharacterized protein